MNAEKEETGTIIKTGRGEPAPQNVEKVQVLKTLVEGKKTVGIASISRLPTPQLQQIRKKLKGSAELRVSKNLLMKRALQDSEYDELIGLIEEQSGLIITDLDPFELWEFLKNSMTKGPAKGGEIAEEDIMVHSGATSLKPGPVIGELQRGGIPCKVEKGQIVIQKDMVLVKEGEIIKREIASLLKKLEINPISIGLKLRGVYSDGILIRPEHLDVDLDKLTGDIAKCNHNAFNLAIGLGYTTPGTIPYLLLTNYQKALNLCLSLPYFTRQTIGPLLAKGASHGRALANVLKS